MTFTGGSDQRPLHAQEDGTTSNNIKAYFNVYEGTYSDYEPIINIASWNAWVDDMQNYADQVQRSRPEQCWDLSHVRILDNCIETQSHGEGAHA